MLLSHLILTSLLCTFTMGLSRGGLALSPASTTSSRASFGMLVWRSPLTDPGWSAVAPRPRTFPLLVWSDASVWRPVIPSSHGGLLTIWCNQFRVDKARSLIGAIEYYHGAHGGFFLLWSCGSPGFIVGHLTHLHSCVRAVISSHMLAHT